MKAYINIYGSKEPREISLSSALTPEAYIDHGTGELEEMRAQINENTKAIGVLAAFLVEAKLVTVDELNNGYNIGSSVFFSDKE